MICIKPLTSNNFTKAAKIIERCDIDVMFELVRKSKDNDEMKGFFNLFTKSVHDDSIILQKDDIAMALYFMAAIMEQGE
jgi:hypothetical protein